MTPEITAMQTILVNGLSHAVTSQSGRTYVERLIRSGAQPDLFLNCWRHLWETELRLYQHNRSFSLPDLMDAAGATIDMDDWLLIAELWQQPVDLKPEGFIDTLQLARAVRHANQVAAKIVELGKSKPTEVRRWLPNMVSTLAQVSHNGQTSTWDPDRLYLEGETSMPLYSTGFGELDAMLKGDHALGGYRLGDLHAYYSISGGGKSTWSHSVVATGVEYGLRVLYVPRERPRESEVVALYRALCGDKVTLEQLEDRQFGLEDGEAGTPEHEKYEARQRVREQVVIPEIKSDSLEELETLIMSLAPHLVVIDPYEGMRLARTKGAGTTWRDSGEASQYLLNLSKLCPIVVTQQLSPQQKAEWDKRHTVERIMGFGDNTLLMRSNFACILGKHWNLPRTVHFVCKKRTIEGGDVDLPFDLQYSTSRACIYSSQGFGE